MTDEKDKDEPPMTLEQILAAVMKESLGMQRTLRDLARDHLREKGGWIEINGVRFHKGDIPEEH